MEALRYLVKVFRYRYICKSVNTVYAIPAYVWSFQFFSKIDARVAPVSHTRNYAAVILALTPCAIDIENIERDFSRALPRYTTPQEQLIGTALPNPQLYPALFWCAKEALYKLKRNSGIDFLQDLHIDAANPNNQTIQARAHAAQHMLHYLEQDSLCCVYAWE